MSNPEAHSTAILAHTEQLLRRYTKQIFRHLRVSFARHGDLHIGRREPGALLRNGRHYGRRVRAALPDGDSPTLQ